MSRTGAKILLHYVLHKFNRANSLSLINRNFHAPIICMDGCVSWRAVGLIWIFKDAVIILLKLYGDYENPYKILSCERNRKDTMIYCAELGWIKYK